MSNYYLSSSLLLITILLSCINGSNLESNSHSGKATYYGGNDYGNACGYSGIPKSTFPYGYYAAAGSNVFNSGYECGACYEITCIGAYGDNPNCHCDSSTPSVTVQVFDQCYECADGHFDLNPSAMERIVGDGLSGTCGIIEINYKRVTCDYSRNIQIRNKEGTSQWWYGMHIDYIANYGSLYSVTVNNVHSMTKSDGPSFWVLSNTNSPYPLSLPLNIELKDINGNIVKCVIYSFNGGAVTDCGDNF